MKPDLKLVADTGSQLEVDVFDPPPQQAEMPFAVVDGEPLTQLPKDLYIPPDALQVFLEAFEGPLDLLLYLIRRQNLDVLDIPIAEITRQYMQYIEVMQELQLELAGEYLLMAAMLAEIKSRMLLPHLSPTGEEEDDPRAELVRRLQEYERFKKAAEDLDRLPRMERDTVAASVEIVERKVVRVQPQVSLQEMLLAFKEVLSRADLFAHHHIRREQLSVRQRMSDILDRLRESAFIEFVRLFDPTEGRMGVTVTFIAVLELMKEGLLEIVQAEPYAPIHVRPASGKRHLTVVGEADTNLDFDAENVAALAQPAHPDENDDPDDEALSAAPPEVSAEVGAGEQGSLQVGEAAAVAQPEAAALSEAAVVPAEVAPEQVVAQAGVEAVPASDAAAANAAVTAAAESALLDDPATASGAAAQASAGAILEPAAVASVDVEPAVQSVELQTEAGSDAVAAAAEPAALAEPAVAASEAQAESLLPEEHAALAESPSVVEAAPAAIVFQADATAATAECVVTDAEPRVEADVDALAADQMPVLAAEATLAASAAAELEAGQPTASPTISPPTSFAARGLDVASGFEVQPLAALEAAESAATDPGFEHIHGAAPIHVDAGFAQGFEGPVFETDRATLPLATDASHEFASGTLLLEPPSFAQFPSDTLSETQLAEPTESVGAMLDSEPAGLSQLVACRVETQVLAGDDAAPGTSPAEPVDESSAPMTAELEAAQWVLEQAVAPALTDADFEADLPALEAAEAEASRTPTLFEADAEPAIAALNLVPAVAADAPQAASSEVEASAGLVVVASESLDSVADVPASPGAGQRPEQVAVAALADQPSAPQLSGPDLEPELPAMTVFEAADAEPGCASDALETDVGTSAVAMVEQVPDEFAAASQAAESDTDVAISFEFVASALLDDVVTDTPASIVEGQEPEHVVGPLAEDQAAAPQLSDPGFEPAMTAFEAFAAEASPTPALLEAQAEAAAITTLDLVAGDAADELQAAASDVEVSARLEAVASELLDDAATDAHAPLPADQEPESIAVGLIADQPARPALSDPGFEPAMTAFEVFAAEASPAPALLEAQAGAAAITTLDLVAGDAADELQAAASDVEVSARLEVAASELSHEVATDAPASMAADPEPEQLGSALVGDQSGAPPLEDSGLEAAAPPMAAFEVAEAGDSPTLAESGTVTEVAATVDFEPVMPSAAPEALAPATTDPAVSANREIVGSEWFDDFVIDVPAVGALQHQLRQGVVASIAEPTDAAALNRTGREADVSAMTALEVGKAAGPASGRTEAGAATEVVAALDLEPAAPSQAAGASPPATVESTVSASQEVRDSEWFDDFVIDVPALGALQPPLEQSVVASIAEPADASALNPSDLDLAVDVPTMTAFAAAEAPVGSAAVRTDSSAETQVDVTGQGEPCLEAAEVRADVDVAAVTGRSATVAEPEGFDQQGAPPAAASLATEPVAAVASAASLLLPERQPASTTPVLLQDAEPQVAVALSAIGDVTPPSEQLRRGSVTALLDEYPAGTMQWETRDTNSVESAYEVDVAAFSSPLAFEHHPLRDDSD